MTLSQKNCIPCKGGTPPLQEEQISSLLKQLDPNWKVVDSHHLTRVYKFPDFKTALMFTNQVGDLAESQGHHPDIALSWGQVILTIFTHKIKGLTESDFILAAKIDELTQN